MKASGVFHLLKMASRQKVSSDDPQHGIEDEEIVSGGGQGDEIMEEVEEQEDGYSVYPCRLYSPPHFNFHLEQK